VSLQSILRCFSSQEATCFRSESGVTATIEEKRYREMEDAFEILPDKLYYLPVKHGDNPVMRFSRYECFCVDEELVYWNFFLDFGPLNLGQLYRFCLLVNRKIGTKLMPRPVNRPLLLYAGPSRQKQTNAVYLLLSYLLLYHDKSVQELCFEHKSLSALCESCLSFHDASQGICTYNLTVVDCLRGLRRARELRFFDFDRFDVLEYEHFESVENGDLNWIVYPDLCGDDSRHRSMHKPMLAFAGPHYCHSVSPEGYVTLTPDSYIDYFKKKDVGLVVRLNKKMYDETEFTRNDIRHIEHSYQDGSIPPLPLLMTIIDKMESSNGGIAVHCKAGLGRTGTIIGAYLMKHFDMTHSEVIGWMRICRPGMVSKRIFRFGHNSPTTNLHIF